MKKTMLAILNHPNAAVPAHPFQAAFSAEAPLAGRQLAIVRAIHSGGTEQVDIGSAQSVSGKPDDPARPILLGWNPLSWAGCQTVWQQAENALAGLPDELVIMADPWTNPFGLQSQSFRDLERLALHFGSGLTSLVQLAAKRFAERGTGTIVLILTGGSYPEQPGFVSLYCHGLVQAAQEALVADPPAGCRLLALRDDSGQPDLLARQVIKVLEDWPKDTGKIQKFTGRSGLFSRF